MANTIPKSPFHVHCTSPIFTIVAGPEGDEYTVHSNLLEKSPVLKAVVNGEWKESSERLIRWEQWDSATVSMFVEWLYTGEYCCVYPVFMKRREWDSDFASMETSQVFEKIKQRKKEREAAAQAKMADEAEYQARNAVNNEPDSVEESSEPKTIIEAPPASPRQTIIETPPASPRKTIIETPLASPRKTFIDAPPASPRGGYNIPVFETALYKGQMQRYANYLRDAREEKAIIKGRISELEQVMSELEQISQGRSIQVTEDLKLKLQASAKSARGVSYARDELEIQRKLERTLTSALQELSFEPRCLKRNCIMCIVAIDECPFRLKKPALIQGHEEFASWPGFREHPLHSLNFAPPFLAHATVYALGQYTQIPRLQAIAFRALQVVLKSVHPVSPTHSLAARGFAILVQYVYAHVDAGDPLRELVAHFAAWNQTTLALEPDYRWVLNRGGDFVLDLTDMLTQRLAKDG